MASTFSQIKSGLDDISSKNSKNRSMLSSSRASLLSAQANLAGMTAAYSGLVADINDAATANPTDEAYQLAKSEKDKLVSDFQSLKTYCDALIAAFDGVTE